MHRGKSLHRDDFFTPKRQSQKFTQIIRSAAFHQGSRVSPTFPLEFKRGQMHVQIKFDIFVFYEAVHLSRDLDVFEFGTKRGRADFRPLQIRTQIAGSGQKPIDIHIDYSEFE